MTKHFDQNEALRFGWEIAKKNVRFFIPVLIGIFLINFFSSYVDRLIPQQMTFVRLVLGVVGWVIGAIISLGLLKISLKFADHKTAEYEDFRTSHRKVLHYIASSIIYGIIVGVGLVLLIVPGIILAVRLQFFGYFISDQDAGPVETLQKSWKITDGLFWQLLWFDLILMVINLLGTLALFIGLIWTFPMTQVASAYLYRHINRER